MPRRSVEVAAAVGGQQHERIEVACVLRGQWVPGRRRGIEVGLGIWVCSGTNIDSNLRARSRGLQRRGRGRIRVSALAAVKIPGYPCDYRQRCHQCEAVVEPVEDLDAPIGSSPRFTGASRCSLRYYEDEGSLDIGARRLTATAL